MTDQTSTPFDWRSYAQRQGVPPMHAWIAVQRAFRNSIPGGRVTSPTSLDRLAADETMHDVIRAAIDDVTEGA